MDPEKEEKKQQLAEIVSGKVVISGPVAEEGGEGAVLTPGEGVQLWVNGKEVKGSFQVYSGDEVEILPVHLQEPARIETKITADKMTVEARYTAPREIKYTIPDHPPTPELMIAAQREEKSGADLSPEEIKDTLRNDGVVYGLDKTALPGLIVEPGSWRAVAAGRPPVQGRHGYLEPLFREGLQRVSYDRAKARVDYRKRFKIAQVEKGRVIARIHPPRPGEPGMRVTGEKISPEPVSPAELRCDSGAALNDAHTEVVALISGVPVYGRRGKQYSVGVDNIYLHRGDVDIKSGHLDFEGHLKIEGGVKEGLQVKAVGDIELAENGSGAEITAGGSVVFKKNCIKCRVRAGSLTLQLKELGRLCHDLTDGVHLALNMGRELIEEIQRRGLYTEAQLNIILRALIQKKLPDLPELSGRALTLSRELHGALPESLKITLQDCQLCLKSGGSLTLDRLQQLHEALGRDEKGWPAVDPGGETASISAYYVQNSILLCPGDILVDGPGAYNSHFDCGGAVHINRIFRGGSIKAGGDIYIGEAGVPRLTRMQGLIETAGPGQIYLEQVYENTRVKIGESELYLERDLRNVRIYRDQEGDLKVGRLK